MGGQPNMRQGSSKIEGNEKESNRDEVTSD
jgi:hypothetical protein